MKDLEISPTKNTPHILFRNNGYLLMEGRSYPNEAVNFFEPLFNWVEEFRCDKIDFDIKLEYFNTGTCKHLLTLLKVLYRKNEKSTVNLFWYHEENDTDILEIGQHIENILGEKIIYRTY